MIDAQTQAVLEGLVRRLTRSLLQYVSEAFPWTSAGEVGALAKVQEMAKEQQDAVGALVRCLAKQRIRLPYTGAYPMSFTTINFISLDHMLVLLSDWQERAMAHTLQDLAQIADPEARRHVQNILDLQRRHAETLRSLAATQPQGAL